MATNEFSDLIILLEQRAAALKPNQDLIESAIRRCERYQRSNGSKPQESDDADMVLDSTPTPNGVTPQIEQALATKTEQSTPSENNNDLSSEQTVELSVARTLEESRLTDEQINQHRKVAEKHKVSASDQQKKRRLLKPGTEIQGYRIMGLLGKGGMGQVYRALQISMNREVAFKVLSPRYAASKSFRTRFLREAHSAGRLHHRHLIAVHDVDETPEGMLFFSMELVEGKSIANMIDDQGSLDEAEALRICKQTLDALAYAHDRGIIHRDIKPDNIILNSEGSAKVADLGLSRMDEDGDEESDGRVTAANTMMGTPYYMSPEQSRDAHTVDHRTDLYSLGATLYHMICGEVPFDGETPLDVVVAASTEKLVFIDPQPSPGVKRFIQMLMAKDPDDRPENAQAALQILERLEMDPRASLSKTNSTKILVSVTIIVLIAMLIIVAAMSSAPQKIDSSLDKDEHGLLHENDPRDSKAELATTTLRPVNLLELFYYDMGDEPIHANDMTAFQKEGHGTVRFDSLMESAEDGRLHLRFELIGRRILDRSLFSLQFMTSSKSRGPRARGGMPSVLISPHGVFYGDLKSIVEKREFDSEGVRLGDINNHMQIDFITDGRQVTITVIGHEEKAVTIDLAEEVQSIDLRWGLNSEMKGRLSVLSKMAPKPESQR